MEVIMNWERLQKLKLRELGFIRVISLTIVFLLPTIYVVAANYCGLNEIIGGLASEIIPAADPLREVHISLVPLSTEYLVFTAIFISAILLTYGKSGLRDFPISTSFLGIIGVLYSIDNLSGGNFPALQILVPTTATLAANVLSLLGYPSNILVAQHPYYGSMTVLAVENFPQARFGIAWPCAGIESALIYTVTALLFLRRIETSWKRFLIYFTLGAIVTYFINVARIVTLFSIAIEKSPNFMIGDPDFQRFHNYYGPLYSVIWIISYPLLIIGAQILYQKLRRRSGNTADKNNDSTQYHV